MLDQIGLLDIDTNETATFRQYDDQGALINELVVNGAGDSTSMTVDLLAANVSRLELEFSASAAVTELIFCQDAHSGSVVDATGESSSVEGESYQLTLDENSATISQWVVNWGDGNVESFAAGANPTHTYADNGSNTIVATAFADDGNVYLASGVNVEVDNVDPVLTIAGATTVEAGSAYVLDLSSIDPGADTISQWIVDWGDGTDPETIAGDPNQVSHVYASAGEFTITAQAFDEDSQAEPSEVSVRARGNEGGELFNLVIDGATVAQYEATTQYQDFVYEADSPIVIGDVRIEFVNDTWDPDNGIDFNLIVDFVDLDGQIYQTEAPDVYSTGTWMPEDGVTPGFRESESLHTNGYFQFGVGSDDTVALTPYVIQFGYSDGRSG